MQSRMALLLAGILISSVTGSPIAYAVSPAVSAEVETIVATSYEQWHSSLGVRQSCSSGATIVYATIDGRRGEYRTQTGEVVIDPTDSVVGMGEIVVHELSHHTFLACGVFADADFAAAFYGSQDLPEDRDWFDYTTGWSATPAEHFAEAMAIAISGSGEGGISVGSETTTVVSRWLAGAPSEPPADSYEPVPYSPGTGSTVNVAIDHGNGESAVAPQPTNSDQAESISTSAEISADTEEPATTVLLVNSWKIIGPV